MGSTHPALPKVGGGREGEGAGERVHSIRDGCISQQLPGMVGYRYTVIQLTPQLDAHLSQWYKSHCRWKHLWTHACMRTRGSRSGVTYQSKLQFVRRAPLCANYSSAHLQLHPRARSTPFETRFRFMMLSMPVAFNIHTTVSNPSLHPRWQRNLARVSQGNWIAHAWFQLILSRQRTCKTGINLRN